MPQNLRKKAGRKVSVAGHPERYIPAIADFGEPER
jgi:hypothetical protein